MTHPAEHELLAFVDSELTGDHHAAVLDHVSGCRLCQSRVAERRNEAIRDSALFSALDHRAPRVSADALIARASRRRVWYQRPLLAAGVTLTLMAGVAAAAVPGSALRRYLTHVISGATIASAPRAASITGRSSAPASPASGVGFLPASTVRIAFRDAQSEGVIRIALRDSAAVRVEHRAGRVGYVLTPTGVDIENAGSHASYLLLLPRAAKRIVVRVGDHTVFVKSGDHIDTITASDSDGTYTLPFTQLPFTRIRRSP